MKFDHSHSPPLLFLMTLTLTLVGCGGDDVKIQNVSGTATFGGKPIAYGQIDFVPDSSANHTGPAGFAEIIDGKYSTSETGRGVVAGAHIARVTAYEAKPDGKSQLPPLFVSFSLPVKIEKNDNNLEIPESAKGFGVQNAKPSGPPAVDP